MQNFLTRMNSKSKFFKFLGDNHKSGLPDPAVDHPLAPSGKNQTQHAAAPMWTIELVKIFVDNRVGKIFLWPNWTKLR